MNGKFVGGVLNGTDKATVRNALINSAVDERLAMAIFNAVSHGKNQSIPRPELTTVVPLESLCITAVDYDTCP